MRFLNENEQNYLRVAMSFYHSDFNDEQTRDSYKDHITPMLQNLMERGEIHDFYIKCDENNNTKEVVDANEFRASVSVCDNASNWQTYELCLNEKGVGITTTEGADA